MFNLGAVLAVERTDHIVVNMCATATDTKQMVESTGLGTQSSARI